MIRDHHIFFSYSRLDDNNPVNAEGEGWVTAFERELTRRHQNYSGRKLKIFFDKEAIVEGQDWRRRLGEGIRTSRLFIAFLSRNYITSKNCLWEWDEYLRREHSSACGDDGITPIFFVRPSDITAEQDEGLAAWVADLNRRNRTFNCDLHPWFGQDPAILKQLDHTDPSPEENEPSRDCKYGLHSLAGSLTSLDKHIAARLDRIALADLAPGNIPRSHEHFVGRHRELSELHDIILNGGPKSGGRGTGGNAIIAAAFSLGGLGKTALARQYAHSYAEFFAAGGTWEISCEGTTSIGEALLRLADSQNFKDLALLSRNPVSKGPTTYLIDPLVFSDAQRSDYRLAAEVVLAFLKRATFARVSLLQEQLAVHPGRHSPTAELQAMDHPRALLVLDNVDQSSLLSANEVAQLIPEEWLELIVTTRLNPESFGGSDRTFECLEVRALSEKDALHLMRDFQQSHCFPNDTEDAAASEIVRALGGYTLAVELVAAYLGDRAKQGYFPTAFLRDLKREGLAWVDSLSERAFVDKEVRHSEDKDDAERKRQNRVSTLIGWSLARLSQPARTALEFASLLVPDAIPLTWLKIMTCRRHPNVDTARPDQDHCWPAVWRELHGLRLLHSVRLNEQHESNVPQLPETVRLHRLVAQHITTANERSSQTYAEFDQFVEELALTFEQQVFEAPGELRRDQHPWLLDLFEHLIATEERNVLYPISDNLRRLTPSLLRKAQSTADFEGRHGSLARALNITRRILTIHERILSSNPGLHEEAKHLSASVSSMGDLLSRRGLPGDADEALLYYRRGLEIRESLLAREPKSTQVAREVSISLFSLGDLLSNRGLPNDQEEALSHYRRALEVSESLLAANPESVEAARDVSVVSNKLGNLLQQRRQPGDTDLAFTYYKRGLEVREQVLDANPDSAQAARDVSISLDRLGDSQSFRGQPGDTDMALAHYQRALDLLERQLAANPDSTEAARDVTVSLNKLARALARRGKPGDASQAVGHLDRSLRIGERMLAANPDSAQAERDVWASLVELGLFHSGGGPSRDDDKALGYFERGLQLSERLLAANPASGQAMKDLSMSLMSLGDFLVQQRMPGHVKKAFVHFQRSYEVGVKLGAASPTSAEAARIVALSLDRLGDVILQFGLPKDIDKAFESYRRGLEIRETVMAGNPKSAEAIRDMVLSLERMATFVGRREGGQQEALALQTRALGLTIKLREQNPNSLYYQRTAAITYFRAYERAQAAGNQVLASQYLDDCLSVLNSLVQAGMELDQSTMALYRHVTEKIDKRGKFNVPG